MTTTSGKTALLRALAAFAIGIIAGQAIITGLGIAFPSLDTPSSSGLIVGMVSALVGGQTFAKHADREMTAADKTRFAFGATLIALALAALFFAAAMAYYGLPLSFATLAFALTGDPSVTDASWLWIAFAIGAVLLWAVSWFFSGMGAKGVIRARDRQAAKGR